ncbi:MAG: hypothetical protein AAGI90_05890 [Chlamydiota bacterium]
MNLIYNCFRCCKKRAVDEAPESYSGVSRELSSHCRSAVQPERASQPITKKPLANLAELFSRSPNEGKVHEGGKKSFSNETRSDKFHGRIVADDNSAAFLRTQDTTNAQEEGRIAWKAKIAALEERYERKLAQQEAKLDKRIDRITQALRLSISFKGGKKKQISSKTGGDKSHRTQHSTNPEERTDIQPQEKLAALRKKQHESRKERAELKKRYAKKRAEEHELEKKIVQMTKLAALFLPKSSHEGKVEGGTKKQISSETGQDQSHRTQDSTTAEKRGLSNCKQK